MKGPKNKGGLAFIRNALKDFAANALGGKLLESFPNEFMLAGATAIQATRPMHAMKPPNANETSRSARLNGTPPD